MSARQQGIRKSGPAHRIGSSDVEVGLRLPLSHGGLDDLDPRRIAIEVNIAFKQSCGIWVWLEGHYSSGRSDPFCQLKHVNSHIRTNVPDLRTGERARGQELGD